MPDLLLEIFCEEIPARMQAKAADDLKRLVTDALVERGLLYESSGAFATPRRLALHIEGLPVQGKDIREEKKGPRVGAPEGAVMGFLRSAGLTSLDQAKIESDPKKGDFYVAVIDKPGQKTTEALAEIIPAVIRTFPWPKSMRWGAASAAGASLRWVRPLHSIIATFGTDNDAPEVIHFDVDGLVSGDTTRGHRFMAPGEIRVKRFADYEEKLKAAKVVLRQDSRKDIIRADAKNLASAQNFEVIEDEGLLDEVSGLVEWPVVLMGSFDPAFLAVPAEAIRATIRANQKCFVLKDASGALAPKFLATANIEASDGGKTIIAGNERVIRARLSDAKFFWETDQKVKLEDRVAKLDTITFHAKLGSQGARVQRIVALAKEIAPLVGADVQMAHRAALLAKADLVTEMVGEFPELQGLMGRKYALLQGEHARVAAAIEEHYKPLGPTDQVPSDPVSIAVALADKLDTLIGFWSIDEKPTGSKDPFALRRAALGVIRILIDNNLSLSLSELISLQFLRRAVVSQRTVAKEEQDIAAKLTALGSVRAWQEELGALYNQHAAGHRSFLDGVTSASEKANTQALDLLAFLNDRLKVQLRDSGARHDLVDAVLGAGNDSPLLIKQRVDALGAFLSTDDGQNLLAGYRRAANILRAEEKKDGAGAFDGVVAANFTEQAEHKLNRSLENVAFETQEDIKEGRYIAALGQLATLRQSVDAFFNDILVNAPEAEVRLNRLRLLSRLRNVMHQVADFSKISG